MLFTRLFIVADAKPPHRWYFSFAVGGFIYVPKHFVQIFTTKSIILSARHDVGIRTLYTALDELITVKVKWILTY